MNKNITITSLGMMSSGIAARSVVAGHRTIVFNINQICLETKQPIFLVIY